jgi:hypothetical protein
MGPAATTGLWKKRLEPQFCDPAPTCYALQANMTRSMRGMWLSETAADRLCRLKSVDPAFTGESKTSCLMIRGERDVPCYLDAENMSLAIFFPKTSSRWDG